MDDTELARALLGVGAEENPTERLNLEKSPQWAQRYASRWLKSVSAELRHELREGCADVMRAAARAAEQGTAWATRRMESDANVFRIAIEEGGVPSSTGGGPSSARANVSPLRDDGSDDDDDDGNDGDDDGGGGGGGGFRAPRSQSLLFSHKHGLLFLWRGGGGASRRGVVAVWSARSASPMNNGEQLQQLQLRSAEPPGVGAEFEVCEVASMRGALSRARTVINVDTLTPTLAALLIPGAGASSSPSSGWGVGGIGGGGGGDNSANDFNVGKPWKPVSAADMVSSSLNSSQAGAIAGLHGGGPVGLVQGPPGTGKSALIAQVVVSCVPEGKRVLACTATNQVRVRSPTRRTPLFPSHCGVDVGVDVGVHGPTSHWFEMREA